MNTKKLRIFDFDDTLFETEAKVIITSADGISRQITPAEYAVYEPLPGDKFDFSQFNAIINPTLIRSIAKRFYKIVTSTDGSRKSVILTARGSEAAPHIKDTIKKYFRVNIEVVTLGTGDPMAKANWILNKIQNEGYNDIFFVDDSSKNILATYRTISNLPIKYKLVDIDYEFILSKCNIFGICGDSGSGKSTLAGMLKKFFSNSFALECDRYHKWERGDEKWEEYTHLNPDANYITKMNEDIFNLKLGNSIYQVDYDHKTGTFTESQLIEPSENTIVCGLHSLYSKDDHLYNLKIFIDTDEQLKTQWKIQRDVNERGHTLEKVLDQISKRKGDYEKYIHPQRDNSDLVVKFFLDKEGNTQLQLSVHTKHDIGNILETLRRCEVGYEVGSQGDFTSITFLKYKDKSLWEDPTTPVYHNYYDYVIYFILNLGLEV